MGSICCQLAQFAAMQVLVSFKITPGMLWQVLILQKALTVVFLGLARSPRLALQKASYICNRALTKLMTMLEIKNVTSATPSLVSSVAIGGGNHPTALQGPV